MRVGLLLLFLLLSMATGGCQKGTDPQAVSHASVSYEEATKLFQARKFEEAAAAYASAMRGGVLNVDSYCDAATRRAECLARLGQFDEAHQLLQDMEKGAPNLADVHITRCFVFEKQGNASQANDQLRLAHQYDSAIPRIAE